MRIRSPKARWTLASLALLLTLSVPSALPVLSRGAGAINTGDFICQMGMDGTSNSSASSVFKTAVSIEFVKTKCANDVIILTTDSNVALTSITTSPVSIAFSQRYNASAFGQKNVGYWYGIASQPLVKENLTLHLQAHTGNYAGSVIAIAVRGISNITTFDQHAGLPSVASSGSSLTTTPSCTLSTSTANDMLLGLVFSQAGPRGTAAAGFKLQKSITTPAQFMETNISVSRQSSTSVGFTLSTAERWVMVCDALQAVAVSTAGYTPPTGPRAVPPPGVSIRLRPLTDNSVWDADSTNNANTTFAEIEQFKPAVLERYISGFQDPNADVVPMANGRNMTIQQFLQESMNVCIAANPSCVMTARISLDEWTAGTFNITAQDLLDFPITPPIRIISLDNWGGKSGFSTVHNASVIAKMFRTIYALGATGTAVNQCGGYASDDGYASWADVCADTSDWLPDTSQLDGVHAESNILYVDLFIDFPQPMEAFKVLNVTTQAEIYLNLTALQTIDGYNLVYPIYQGTVANTTVPYLWDAQAASEDIACYGNMYGVFLSLSQGEGYSTSCSSSEGRGTQQTTTTLGLSSTSTTATAKPTTLPIDIGVFGIIVIVALIGAGIAIMAERRGKHKDHGSYTRASGGGNAGSGAMSSGGSTGGNPRILAATTSGGASKSAPAKSAANSSKTRAVS